MTRPVSSLLLAALLVAVAAPPAPAYADEPARRAAKRHYDRGQKLFSLHKFDEALDQYQKAFDAEPLPGFLFLIGQCHRNLGDFDAAIFSFKRYLRLDPEADNRVEVETLIDELEDKQAQAKSEQLRLGGSAPPTRAPAKTESGAFYTRWWFWTGIVVVGAGAGVGIYATTRPDGPPSTTLGNIGYGK